MNKQFLKDTLGWGIVLWLIGYVFGMLLFSFVPIAMIGWIILPIGTVITIWVLIKKIKGKSLQYFLLVAVTWTLIAVIFDYVFLVLAFNPEDGYYKLDVYMYYALTLILPLIVGLYNARNSKKNEFIK